MSKDYSIGDRWRAWERNDAHASSSIPRFFAPSFAWYLALATVFHLWIAAKLPPTEDELYYWTWSKNLGLSYYDHPPLLAYAISFVTAIFGNSVFAIRLVAIGFSLGTVLLLVRLTKNTMLLSLFLFSPLYLFGGVLTTPDSPLIFFWALYCLWLCGVNSTLSQWSDDPITRVYRQSPVYIGNWILGGVVLGFGLLSKYTMALAVPCTVITLLFRYPLRAWIRGFAAQMGSAFVVTLPVLIFNLKTGFTSFRYQWSHGMGEGFSLAQGNLLELSANQILLLGALPILMLPWILAKAKELTVPPRLHVCFNFYLLPLLFFAFAALKNRLEANWPLVAYIAFWPLASRILERNSFRLAGRLTIAAGFAIPLVVTPVVAWHVVSPIERITVSQDRISKLRAQNQLAESMATELRARPEQVFAPTYQWTSYLRFHGIPAEQIFPGPKLSQFTVQPVDICQFRNVLVIESNNSRQPVTNCFTGREIVKEFPLMVRGQEIARFQLVKYTRDLTLGDASRYHETLR